MVRNMVRGGMPFSLGVERRRLFGDRAMFIDSRVLENLPSQKLLFSLRSEPLATNDRQEEMVQSGL